MGFAHRYLSIAYRGLQRARSRVEQLAVDRGWRADRKWRNLSADQYGEYLADDHPDRRWFARFVQQMAPCRVLEIGAGSLHEARLLFQPESAPPVDYTVVDVAKDMLELGRKEFPMIRFIEGDVNRLQLPDDAFDIVYCRHVLEHQPYYDQPIREMMRVSRGVVVINLFRWSLHRDIIRRTEYYSNSYEINKFLGFLSGLETEYEHFLVQKGEGQGENIYEDENIRRTGDHLLIVIQKQGKWGLGQVYQPLDRIGAIYHRRPYASFHDEQ